MKLNDYQIQTLKRVETGNVSARRYGLHPMIYSYEETHFEIIRRATMEKLIKEELVLLVPTTKGSQSSYRAKLTEKGKDALKLEL